MTSRRLTVRIGIALTTTLILAATAQPHAADRVHEPQTGTFVTDKGWGQLDLMRDASGVLRFDISSINGNATCEVSGVVLGEIGETDSSADACRVTLKRISGGILVNTITDEACRQFCGFNAGIDGEYFARPKACSPISQQTTRSRFQRAYDQRKYAEARKTLDPWFGRCRHFLDWSTEAEIRNDLAVTYHKLGMRAACLKVLEPYTLAARGTDDAAIEGWQPSTAEIWLDIVHRARTNLRLCEKLR